MFETSRETVSIASLGRQFHFPAAFYSCDSHPDISPKLAFLLLQTIALLNTIFCDSELFLCSVYTVTVHSHMSGIDSVLVCLYLPILSCLFFFITNFEFFASPIHSFMRDLYS